MKRQGAGNAIFYPEIFIKVTKLTVADSYLADMQSVIRTDTCLKHHSPESVIPFVVGAVCRCIFADWLKCWPAIHLDHRIYVKPCRKAEIPCCCHSLFPRNCIWILCFCFFYCYNCLTRVGKNVGRGKAGGWMTHSQGPMQARFGPGTLQVHSIHLSQPSHQDTLMFL